MSLNKKSQKMMESIKFIYSRGKGYGFQQANLTFDLPLDFLILPCAWFDPDFIRNPCDTSGCQNFFKHNTKIYNFDNFFPGSFCYHWHNKWNDKIESTSIITQLVNIIREKLLN